MVNGGRWQKSPNPIPCFLNDFIVMDVDDLETKAAGAILQQPVEVEIGGAVYRVVPPSLATLILASAAIAKLPAGRLDDEDIVSECLRVAKDCEALGEITAILILGAKGLTETKEVRTLFGTKTVETDRKGALAKAILEELTPRRLSEVLGLLLAGMDAAFFFGITDFLVKINLLRATNPGKATTTASGQS
jgi:hypothetical protein